ncbi:ankyrin repeat domain-containing protein [bacterium]|nr:ankyrin repeat domain-containing protein [bacterium]
MKPKLLSSTFNLRFLLFLLYCINFGISSNIYTHIQASEKTSISVSSKSIEYALKAGNLAEVSQYLDSPAKINKYYEWGFALGIAVKHQHFHLVDYLLEKGGDPNKSGSPTPLEIAVELENREITSLLLESGATVRKYAIRQAKTKNNLEFLRYLTAHAEDPFGPKGAARTALIGVPNIEAAKLLIKLGADIHSKGKGGKSALHFVSDIEVAKLLIGMGLDVNARTDWGGNPLHCYYEDTQSNLDILAYLIESGADVNAVNGDGETPLHAMIRYNHFKQVELLLREGANAQTKDMDSGYPLHSAAWHDSQGIELAKLLISSGADINISNRRGWTPLDVALEHDRPKMAEFLVTQGAKSNAEEDFYEHLSFFERHPNFIENVIICGALGLFVLCGCFGVYSISRLMFAKEEQRLKYFLVLVISIIGAIAFYSFIKMIGEALSV